MLLVAQAHSPLLVLLLSVGCGGCSGHGVYGSLVGGISRDVAVVGWFSALAAYGGSGSVGGIFIYQLQYIKFRIWYRYDPGSRTL